MIRKFILAAVLCACIVPLAHSQSTFGDIRGVTRDPSGLPLPNAAVTVRSLDENNERKVTSGDDGSFLVENLNPGHYQLTADKEGFQESAIDVELSARQSLRADITLTLASQSTAVEVSAVAEQLNTENGTIGDAKSTSQIVQLPLNYRAVTTSPLAALSTSPNVEQDSEGNIAVGAATANMVGYSVDGISTTNVWTSSAATNAYPSSEGIAELKVSAFNNNAEFSQVGDVTFTSKAGTNQFHGSLFEYLQNDALDANVLNFNVKAPKRFNTFGGSLGGPLTIPKLYNSHDKTFFFIDYENNRKRTSQPEQYEVPTADERGGNLNDLLLPAKGLRNWTSKTSMYHNIPPMAASRASTSLTERVSRPSAATLSAPRFPAPINSPTTSLTITSGTRFAPGSTFDGCDSRYLRSKRLPTTTVCSPSTRMSSPATPLVISCWACRTLLILPLRVRATMPERRRQASLHRTNGASTTG
jgi:hypothetical protein